MAALDPDNCIKLFKLDDTQDPRSDPETMIIPARNNMFQAMFRQENNEGPASPENLSSPFPEDGVSLLLEIRIELEELFRHCGDITGIADVLWEDISRRLFDRGFNVRGRQCAKKWDALYSEYVEAARSDDESRISRSEHLVVMEEFFKLRSKYIDSKILEDITEFLSSRFDCTTDPKYPANKEDDGAKSSVQTLTREEFSNLSNEDDCQMLVEAINAAQKILDDNLKDEFDDCQTDGESSGDVGQSATLETQDHGASGSHLVFVRSVKQDFNWDADSTQCFMDLRLYADSNGETRQRILRDYGSIVAFVIHKMLLNGYEVSEDDCRKKWTALSRCYSKDVRRIREAGGDRKVVKSSFWEMDKVLRKYAAHNGVECSTGFEWSEKSVRRLIAIRIPMENAFAMFKRYIILWQYVASQMTKYGFLPTYNECSIRWMELCDSYKLCLETLRRRGNTIEVNWAFYQDMRQGYEQNNKNTEAIVDYRCNVGSGVDSTENSTEASTFTTSISGGETLANIEFESSSNEKVSSIDGLETEESLDSISQQESTISEETEASDQTEFTNLEPMSLKQQFDFHVTRGSDGRRAWNEESTFLLINLKLSRELKFRNPAIIDTDLWKEIATDMQSAGHNVCHQACAERWYQVKAAYEKSVSPRNGETVPKYQEHLELMKLPLNQSMKSSKAHETNRNKNGINCANFVWTEEAVRTLIKLRFSEKIKGLRKYGAPIAAVMQADGYPTIAPGDVSRKWSRMISTYRKALCRNERGEKVKWPYFELLDGYMKGLLKPEEPHLEPETKSPIWTPAAVNKLIDIKLSLDKSFCESDIRASSSLWEKVAAAMKMEGFSVSDRNCLAEWNFLIGAYKKTKKELCNGDGAVIGKYYMMVDEAMSKVIRSDKTGDSFQEPIDFSIARNKRKLNEETGGNNAAKRTKIEEPNHREVMNLNQKVTESTASCSFAENSSEMIVKEDTEDSPILKSVLDNPERRNKTDEMNGINDHSDSSKENVAAFVEIENRSKPIIKKEDTQSRILCHQNPCNELNKNNLSLIRKNILIQDKAVNSTKNIDSEERNGRWSEAATELLIDLKAQHNRQFPLLPRPNIQWEKVAALLGRLGYNYTSAECSNRWDYLKMIYEQKIADLLANRVVQSWSYFDSLDAIYKKLDTHYSLPKKRARVEDPEQLTSPKKCTVSALPMETHVTPVFEIPNSSEIEVADLKKNN